MKTNAPKFIVWLIAVMIGVLGILAKFVALPFLTMYAFWVVVLAFVLLALATIIKGM